MANYTPTFSKPYPSGWVDKPSKTTPVTAAIMDSYDAAIAALEAYLRDNAIDAVSVSVEQFPSDGREWLGTITVGSNQYKIYMPSLKYENSVSDGVKIGTITLGEQSFDVYVPTSSAGGSTVSVVPKTFTGTNIAEITVDGTTYQLYAPTSGGGSGSTVTAEATLTEGTQIGKITIDGVETILYAPTASPITVDAELSATSENAVQNKAVTTELNKKIETLGDESQAPDAVNFDLDSELSLTSVKGVQNKVIAEEFQKYANGAKVVAKATEAETATKANQDSQGNIIDKTYAKKTEIPQGAVVDDSLSSTSENPVQNKVVKAEFDKVNDSISALGKCKNLLKPTLQTTTNNGVTCTANGSGAYTLNGTASETTVFALNDLKLVAGIYKMTGCPNGGSNSTYKLDVYSEALQTTYFADYGDGKTENAPALSGSARIVIYKGKTVNNLVFKPMLTTNLNVTYDDFVPYTGDGNTLIADVAKINSDLSNLKDGTTPVAKAVADEDGNSIKSTYAKKTEVPSGSIVDAELSETSTNPVQNKVVTAELNNIKEELGVNTSKNNLWLDAYTKNKYTYDYPGPSELGIFANSTYYPNTQISSKELRHYIGLGKYRLSFYAKVYSELETTVNTPLDITCLYKDNSKLEKTITITNNEQYFEIDFDFNKSVTEIRLYVKAGNCLIKNVTLLCMNNVEEKIDKLRKALCDLGK